eukprot:12893886-Prorocentrum_lima.AAC.1
MWCRLARGLSKEEKSLLANYSGWWLALEMDLLWATHVWEWDVPDDDIEKWDYDLKWEIYNKAE